MQSSNLRRPKWKDENMNGIHVETYILGKQIEQGVAPVALHCERGSAVDPTKFAILFHERAQKWLLLWAVQEQCLSQHIRKTSLLLTTIFHS